MKQYILLLTTLMASTIAFAHPGGHTLTCKSAKNSGTKQPVEVSLARSNGTGWYAPTISVTVNGQKLTMDTPDEMLNYGETFHNSPLGVITATANNYNDNSAVVFGSFSVVAIPSSVRAFDAQGKRVKWSFQAEKDECNDSSGKATFQGIIHGQLNSNKKDINIETQILDCELTYNSGMAC